MTRRWRRRAIIAGAAVIAGVCVEWLHPALTYVLFAAALATIGIAVERETARRASKCPTCRHSLGGGCCRIGLERECGDGQFEAWEAHGAQRLLQSDK